MRGFRESAAGDESKTDCSVTGRFGAKSASAAWRALVILSRSSPRECGRCRRSSKSCSGGSLLTTSKRDSLILASWTCEAGTHPIRDRSPSRETGASLSGR